MRETRVELKENEKRIRILIGATGRLLDIDFSESFDCAFREYIRALARHDGDLRRVARLLIQAREAWPLAFGDDMVIEGIARLSVLYAAVQKGKAPRAEDCELLAAGRAFESALSGEALATVAVAALNSRSI